MRRREFITLLGGAAAAWPLAVRAQRTGRLPTVGLLVSGTPASHGHWVSAFSRRLGELGWIEGRTITTEYRYAQERREPASMIIADLIRLDVDVLVTAGTANVVAAKSATSTIPIVFAAAIDPVGNALVASLARPGGNVTGLSVQQTDSIGKRFELLRDVLPDFRRLAVMGNVGSAGVVLEMDTLETMARTHGVEVARHEIGRAEDIAPAIEAMKNRGQALYVAADPFVISHRTRINALALGAGLPTTHANRESVEAGGLMSYGPNILDLYRRSAEYVDKILRGAKPAELPVEQPTKFDLVINLKTAKALGLTIPPSMLARVDEVIE